MKKEFKKSDLSEDRFPENFIKHCVADTYQRTILTHKMIKELMRIRQSLVAWDNRESLNIFKCIESANLHTLVDIERQPATSELLTISDFLHHLRQDVANIHARYQHKEKIYPSLEEVIQREHLYCQTLLVILMLVQEKCPWEAAYISGLILQAENQLNTEYNLYRQRKSTSPIGEHLFRSIYQRINVLQAACTQRLLALSTGPVLLTSVKDGDQKHLTAPVTLWDNPQKKKRKLNEIKSENSLERHHKPF